MSAAAERRPAIPTNGPISERRLAYGHSSRGQAEGPRGSLSSTFSSSALSSITDRLHVNDLDDLNDNNKMDLSKTTGRIVFEPPSASFEAAQRRPSTAVHSGREATRKSIMQQKRYGLGMTLSNDSARLAVKAMFSDPDFNIIRNSPQKPKNRPAPQPAMAERRFPVPTGKVVDTTEVRGLVGLQNLGNTCFLNTCVQCLASLEPFSKYFLENHYMYSLDTQSSMRGTLALSFGELLHKMWMGNPYSSASPGTLKERVGKFAPQFTGCRQHDCQEFLRFLLDGLHEDLKCKNGLDFLTADDDLAATLSDAEKARRTSLLYFKGYLSSVMNSFGGQMVSTITCTHCGNRSLCHDPFLDLSLPVPEARQVKEGEENNEQGCELTECFATFTEPEMLDGEDMYSCANCQCRRKASKQLQLAHAPPILVLHIKRFCYTMTAREKLVTKINFPEFGLDLSPFMAEGAAHPPLYDLKAISLHIGGVAGGHYHAICNNRDDGGWYHYNDSTVRPVSLDDMDRTQPYLLFYQQREAF